MKKTFLKGLTVLFLTLFMGSIGNVEAQKPNVPVTYKYVSWVDGAGCTVGVCTNVLGTTCSTPGSWFVSCPEQ